jgi:predicted DNA-binding WGR domain protein
MANVSEGDSSSLHIVLERIDRGRNIARYTFSRSNRRYLRGLLLIRRWGRIDSLGRNAFSSSRVMTSHKPK